eukprot:1731516-Amphidinium_carterae.1
MPKTTGNYVRKKNDSSVRLVLKFGRLPELRSLKLRLLPSHGRFVPGLCANNAGRRTGRSVFNEGLIAFTGVTEYWHTRTRKKMDLCVWPLTMPPPKKSVRME